MARQLRSGPEYVTSDSTERATGEEATSANIAAARAVAETVRTTLGPRGMDKMLVDSSGNVIVTNDGVTLLDEMEITHPAADLVVEIAQAQELKVGDGTTTAVVLAGALLEEAEQLRERGVHASTIVRGYEEAWSVVVDTLEEMAIEVDIDDTETLERIAETAMTGKGSEVAKGHLATLVVRAMEAATRENGYVASDAAAVRSFPGRSVEDSQFVDGVLLDKKPRPEMPTEFDDPDVLIYEGAIEPPETETDVEAAVSRADGADAFSDHERAQIDEQIQHVLDSGADVVLAKGGIDDYAELQLAHEGVLAVRRTGDDDRKLISKASGAKFVAQLDDIERTDLGRVGRIRHQRIREYAHQGNARAEQTLVFEDLPGGEVGTVLLRGGTDHVVEELERAVEDSIGVVTAAIEDGLIVPGGGAPEIAISRALREAAASVEGREQLAVEAFADAVEEIPRILAANGGHDPIDALVELTSRHENGETTAGLDAERGEVVDAFEAGVVEPHRVKTGAVGSAVDVAKMILRIDQVVAIDGFTTGGDEDAGGPGGF